MPERPNLLYIHSDQHCPFVTGCYGNDLVRTPNLDTLARSGIVMDGAYCASPICGPSRMSMLTGQHPFQSRSWTNSHILDSGIPTLAHSMGAAGYRPVLIGRMHSMGPDQLHGYAQRLVGDHSPNFPGGADAVDRGELNGTSGPAHVSLSKSGPGQSGYEVHDEDVTTAAVDCLQRIGSERRNRANADPFCLTVGLMLPHPPYVARKDDYVLYEGRMDSPKKPEFTDQDAPDYLRWWREDRGLVKTTSEEATRARTAYWALVTSMDRMIGRILQALHENDLAENTLVVYTSDHGDMLGEHGMFWKHTFYEESVRVPLVFSWPGVIPAGSRSDHVVSALDVTATILDALGAPALPLSDGRSLMSVLRGEDVDWRDEAYSEYCSDEAWSPPGGCYQRMIRREEWKLVYYHGDRAQLFNLKEDPEELVNRADDPSCAEVLKELRERLLEDWNPEEVVRQMAVRRREQEILRAWAASTRPESQYLWDMRSEMFYLD